MLHYAGKLLGWFVVCILKFLIAPFLLTIDSYSFVEVILISTSGAAIGVFIFYHAGEIIFKWWSNLVGSRKKVFTPFKRKIILLKWKYGLKGLMVISGLISVPLASMLAARLYRHEKNPILMMILGFFLWSLMLTSIAFFMKYIAQSI
jgi:hypothetical protein